MWFYTLIYKVLTIISPVSIYDLVLGHVTAATYVTTVKYGLKLDKIVKHF